MRTPMPVLEQIEVLRSYLRRLQADCNRAMRESGAHYRKRRVCPFAEELRWRRMQNGWELRDVGNACLDELRHARVLSIADFLPGDQITMEVVLQGHERSPERYLISDVLSSKRDEYHYEVWRLTSRQALRTWRTDLANPFDTDTHYEVQRRSAGGDPAAMRGFSEPRRRAS